MSNSSKKQFAYIAHSLMHGNSSYMKINFKLNIKNINRICQYMIDKVVKGESNLYPLAPQAYLPAFLNESKANKKNYKSQRLVAIDFCMLLLSKCDIVHVYKSDTIGGGVIDDIEEASKLGIGVKIYTKYPWED